MASEMEIPLPPVMEAPLPDAPDDDGTAFGGAADGVTLPGNSHLPEDIPPQQLNGSNAEDAAQPSGNPDADPVDVLVTIWKDLEQDERDFDTWSKLLQVIPERDITDIRKAFDSFFEQFPLCFGYWKMFCNLEQARGDASRCEDIMKRAVAAVPLSIDLWQHYIELKKNALQSSGMEGEGQLRDLYQQAIAAAGLEYASSPLWLSFIDWELSVGHLHNAVRLYCQLLLVPNHEHKSNWIRFETLVKQKPMSDILTSEEQEGFKNYEDASTGEIAEDAVREVYLDERKRIADATQTKVDDRVKFEDRIRRPYFHVKPLDDAEIDNWHDYLEYEMQRGTSTSIQTLFERCLVPCALYSSFWQKYVDYLSDKKHLFVSADIIYNVYRRCTQYHCPRDASLYLEWALRLECDEKLNESERLQRALAVLERARSQCIGNPLISLRLLRVHSCMQKLSSSHMLNGNAGDIANSSILPIEQVSHLLSYAADEAEQQRLKAEIPNERLRNRLRVSCTVRMARYHLKRLGNIEKARKVIKEALAQKPTSDELHSALIDCEYSVCPLNMVAIRDAFRYLLSLDGLSERQRETLHRRRVALFEEFGQEAEDSNLLLSSYTALKKIESDGDYRVKIGLKRTIDDANDDDDDERQNGHDVDGPAAKLAALSTDSGHAVKAYQLQQQQQQAALYGPPQAAAWYGGYAVPPATIPAAVPPWSTMPPRLPFGGGDASQWGVAAPPIAYAAPPRF